MAGAEGVPPILLLMRLFALLCLLVPLAACSGTRRLDEHTFLARDGIELNVVRYDQRLFLHYNGEVYGAVPVGRDSRVYFQGERQPQFTNIRADAPGHLAFRVRAAAIRNGAAVLVETTDRGLTWTRQSSNGR